MKYRITKRSLSLLMALVMVLGTLFLAVSCGTGEDNPSQDTVNQTTGELETEKPLAYDTVEKQKFDREFNILSRDDILKDFKVEDLTGDLLDDMLYERNTQIAGDFEIEFSYYDMPYAEVNTTLNTQATSSHIQINIRSIQDNHPFGMQWNIYIPACTVSTLHSCISSFPRTCNPATKKQKANSQHYKQYSQA